MLTVYLYAQLLPLRYFPNPKAMSVGSTCKKGLPTGDNNLQDDCHYGRAREEEPLLVREWLGHARRKAL